MKHLNLIFLFIVILASMSTTTYANGKDSCEKWVSQYNDAHCVYITGLANGPDQGRYIKHLDIINNTAYTRCVSEDMVEDDIYQDLAEDYLGARTVYYFICTDAQGEQCEAVGTDNYTIINSGDHYAGSPTIYAINLTTVQNKYPGCKSIKGKLDFRKH